MLKKLRQTSFSVLRWSEKYTKTDMVYLAKGASWMSTANIIMGGISFLLAIAFANLLPKETFGVYKYVLSVGGFIAAFSLSAGMGSVITQSVSKGFEGILKQAFKTSLVWGIPLSIATLAGALYYILKDNYVLGGSLVIIAIFIPFLNSSQLYTSFLNGKQDFKRITLFGILGTLVQTGVVFLTLLFTDSVVILALAYFASITLITLILYFSTVSAYKPNKEYNKETLQFGKSISVVQMIAGLAGHMDKILIFQILGGTALATYTFALAPVVQLRSILKMMTPLALPKLALQEKETIKKTLGRKVTVFTLGIIAMVILYVLIAPFFYRLFFPTYLEAIIFSQVYVLILLLFPKKLISLTLFAHDQKEATYALIVLQPVVQVILLFTLIPIIGLWGAIVAEIVASMANNFLANHYLARFQKES